jgi:hypothetical protein
MDGTVIIRYTVNANVSNRDIVVMFEHLNQIN